MRVAPLIAIALLLCACGDRPTEPRKLSPAAENRLLGQHYLKTNATKPGVHALPSGLQYRVIVAGDGPKPTIVDTVTIHYRGTTIDGREFETSRDRNQKPAVLALRDVIRGWQEGVQLMPVGSTYEFSIPSNLAYGLQGRPPAIAPNQCLLFTIELIAINAPAPARLGADDTGTRVPR